MKREDVQAFLQRPWGELRAAKEAFWVEQREHMSLTEAFAMADSLRESAITIAGDAFLRERDDDLEDLIALKQKLEKANAARRH